MSAWGLQLISALIEAEDPRDAMADLEQMRVSEESFLNHEARAAFKFIRRFYERVDDYGKFPSKQRVQEKFTTMALPAPQEGLKSLARAVRDEFLQSKLLELQENIGDELATKEPLEVIESIRNQSIALNEQFVADKDMELVTSLRGVVAEHFEKLHANKGMLGIPWPWQAMNEATLGIQEGDSILFYGLRKSMKTWVVLYVATWLMMKGYKVLFFSREMQPSVTAMRMLSILARLDYDRLRKGNLSSAETFRLFSTLDHLDSILDDKRAMWFTRASGVDGGVAGITNIIGKVNDYHPDLVVLDSAYLMSNDRARGSSTKWNDLTSLGQDIKGMAADTKVPTIFVWQENERENIKHGGRKGSTSSLAMATQIAYDVDAGIQVVLDPVRNKISLHFKVTREFQHEGIVINAIPGCDFSFSGYDLFDTEEVVKAAAQQPKPSASSIPTEVKNLATHFSSLVNPDE